MAILLPNGMQQFIDGNGAPYAYGRVYFYVPGTDTPKNTWQDPDQMILNTNPVVLDASGRATIFGGGDYRQVLEDADGVEIWDKETSGGDGTDGASYAVFSGTTTNGQTQILMAEDVPAEFSRTVTFTLGGIQQLGGTDFTTDGSDILTLSTAANGSIPYWGVHSGARIANASAEAAAAAASAAAALISQNAAAASAATASTAATNAGNSATAAAASASTASTAATSAGTSATNAANSASAAATSETNAGNSATAAAASASSASTSATTATTQATNAANSASAASTSATTASTAATNAQTAETNAETAETNAEAAAAAALAAVGAVKVTASDTTAAVLNSKLVAGTNITLTVGSPGGNETLTIASSGGSGIEVITAGENLTDRDLIYQDVYNQRGGGVTKWYKVDADATGPVRISPVVGFALATITSGNTGNAQTLDAKISGFSGLTAGLPVYASATAGAITQTVPATPTSGTQIASLMVGVALSTTEINFFCYHPVKFYGRNSTLADGSAVTVEHWTDSGAPRRTAGAYIASSSYATTVSAALDADLTSRNTYAMRQKIASSVITQSGSVIRITFRASSSEALNINVAYVQQRAASGNDWDYTTTPVQITFNGGSTTVLVAINSTAVSDPITISWSTSNNYIIGYYITTSNDSPRSKTTLAGFTCYEKVGTAADASGVAPSGFSATSNAVGISLIEVQQTTVNEPLTVGSRGVNSASTLTATAKFSDTSNANADTKTAVYNQTGATQDFTASVTF